MYMTIDSRFVRERHTSRNKMRHSQLEGQCHLEAGGKNEGEEMSKGIKEDRTRCFASRVRAYRVEVVKSIVGKKDEDPLWYRVMKSGYGKQPMRKNYLGDTGKLLATKLELEEPNRYTGHCFWRSGATCVANRGANTMKMMRQFNWRNESTALRYTCLLYTSPSPRDRG